MPGDIVFFVAVTSWNRLILRNAGDILLRVVGHYFLNSICTRLEWARHRADWTGNPKNTSGVIPRQSPGRCLRSKTLIEYAPALIALPARSESTRYRAWNSMTPSLYAPFRRK